jgi:hypothetical protein
MLTRSFRRLVVPLVLAGVASLPATAAAQTLSVRVDGTPELSGKVLITVPVTASCSPFEPPQLFFGVSVTVSIEQATKGAIAHGSAFANLSSTDPCDGADHTVLVNVLADSSGPPFKRGNAAFSVSMEAESGQECFPGGPPFCNIQEAFTSAPPVVLKVK